MQRNANEYEGLPSSAYVKEIKPEDIYRVFLDKKNNELEIVLKTGGTLTLPVEAQSAEKKLLAEN